MTCAYCGNRPAANLDHVIPKSVRRNRLSLVWRQINKHRRVETIGDREGNPLPANLLELAPSCFECNIGKGARLLVPPSWRDRLDALNALGIGTFRVWDGSAEALREVVR